MSGREGGAGGTDGPDPLADIVDLVARLDAARLAEQLGPAAAEQLLTGMALVAEALTRSAVDALGSPFGAELHDPDRGATRVRRGGERIVLHDDDASDESELDDVDETG